MPKKPLPSSVSDIAIRNLAAIVKSWTSRLSSYLDKSVSQIITEKNFTTRLTGLLKSISASFEQGALEADIPGPSPATRDLLAQLSHDLAQEGVDVSDASRIVIELRYILLEYLNKEYSSSTGLYRTAVEKVNKFVDELTVEMVESFRLSSEKQVIQQSQALLELSTPVVHLWEGILLLPLVGIVDTYRATQILENLLNKIVHTESTIAILDVTGVPVIDTSVAHHLIKTVEAARMLGAEIILTGISPESAQTLTKLKVNLSEVVTRGTLRGGVEAAFHRLKMDIVRKERENA